MIDIDSALETLRHRMLGDGRGNFVSDDSEDLVYSATTNAIEALVSAFDLPRQHSDGYFIFTRPLQQRLIDRMVGDGEGGYFDHNTLLPVGELFRIASEFFRVVATELDTAGLARQPGRTAAEQHLDSLAQTIYDAQADGDWLHTVDGSPNVASYAAARAVLALDLVENAHVAGWNERVEHEAAPHDRAAEENELTAERLRTQPDTNARIRRLAARHDYAAEGDRIAAARIRRDLR